MFPMDRLDRIVREETKDVVSIIHDYGHLKRIAVGARWIVKILNGTKEEEELAYAAGLLHDIVRPATEKICHAEASGEKSRDILSEMGIDRKTTERVVEAIKGHRKPHEWKSPLHKSVYLADKIFEQMGAYINFRACYYVGECKDFAGKDPIESIIKYFDYRIKKFDKRPFDAVLLPLVEYQLKKRVDFKKLLSEDVPWVREIALNMHDHGRKHDIDIDKAVRGFQPSGKEGEEAKKEALLYMDGELFTKFERILKGS